ncbi:unnamed protein product [Protopolystoma xenopodis]|uniref:Uncharacterized protein n=1 Tax=Protopolystoma xenopodis TaxID=117903 RepID=A0A3S5CTS3_9PLAT|nr:unnamed protein product [Protopolystoma xenopodis]
MVTCQNATTLSPTGGGHNGGLNGCLTLPPGVSGSASPVTPVGLAVGMISESGVASLADSSTEPGMSFGLRLADYYVPSPLSGLLALSEAQAVKKLGLPDATLAAHETGYFGTRSPRPDSGYPVLAYEDEAGVQIPVGTDEVASAEAGIASLAKRLACTGLSGPAELGEFGQPAMAKAEPSLGVGASGYCYSRPSGDMKTAIFDSLNRHCIFKEAEEAFPFGHNQRTMLNGVHRMDEDVRLQVMQDC